MISPASACNSYSKARGTLLVSSTPCWIKNARTEFARATESRSLYVAVPIGSVWPTMLQLNLRLNAEQVRHLDSAAVTSLGLPPHIETALAANLADLRTLQTQIRVIESILHREGELRPEFAILKTAPGIGATLATTITLETGTISRFRTVGQLNSYCRCVESRRVSYGRKKGHERHQVSLLGLHRSYCCHAPLSEDARGDSDQWQRRRNRGRERTEDRTHSGSGRSELVLTFDSPLEV